jgi:hypothetical protein
MRGKNLTPWGPLSDFGDGGEKRDEMSDENGIEFFDTEEQALCESKHADTDYGFLCGYGGLTLTEAHITELRAGR